MRHAQATTDLGRLLLVKTFAQDQNVTRSSKSGLCTLEGATSLQGLCVEAIFSSLFQPQFRAHKPGRKIAEAASGHCHNSHTWSFGQEEVQLREFVSTLHVKPLPGPGNLAADEPHEHSESCTTPFPNSKVVLASTARFAPSCMPRNRLRVMSQHCWSGKGGL